MSDFIQEAADSTRIVKMGLRNHDPETVLAGQARVAKL